MPRPAGRWTSVLIDQHFDSGPHTYTLTRTHQINGRLNARTVGHVVRIRVTRNSYAVQSAAVAEVLTAALTWTLIASAAPADWFDPTPLPNNPSRPPTADSLAGIADALLERASTILAAHTATTAAPTGPTTNSAAPSLDRTDQAGADDDVTVERRR